MRFDLYLLGNVDSNYVFYSNTIDYKFFFDSFSIDETCIIEKAIIECEKGANYKILRFENERIEMKDFLF